MASGVRAGADRRRKRVGGEPRRTLPAVGALCALPRTAALIDAYGREEVLDALRSSLAELRAGLSPDVPDIEDYVLSVANARLDLKARPTLVSVINATGIVVHTNLGRAPLADEARDSMLAAASGYANLEMDLQTGERSSRHEHLDELLASLTGAEAGLAVNNCAGAVLLTLAVLAGQGEVVTSRGELIEIGGGFRIPDVVRSSGASLVEVGTTNRTRIEDYERAIGAETRVILRTHPSNFRMIGFTHAPSLEELTELARRSGLVVVDDIGGGALLDLAPYGIVGEPTVQSRIDAGADIVLFSADKLLGGPQAGLIVGRKALVARIAKHPLARALRLDKLSLAALAATLRLYRAGRAAERVPVVRMLTEHRDKVRARAQAVVEGIGQVGGAVLSIVPTDAYAGGGAMPMHALQSWSVRVEAEEASIAAIARQMRTGAPAIVGRIERNGLMLDARTVSDAEVGPLIRRLAEALR